MLPTGGSTAHSIAVVDHNIAEAVPVLDFAENWMERHKLLTGIGAATAAGAGYEIYEHEKKKYDERRQQGAPLPQGGVRHARRATCSESAVGRLPECLRGSRSAVLRQTLR